MRELLPTGTVTMLFTDIEGSTRLLQELGRERYVRALEAHRTLLREAFSAHGGVEVELQGDSFHFAFETAQQAVLAAADGQRALASYQWPEQPLRVRIGIHTGTPLVSEGLYAGLDVHRAARVMQAGHGGQVLVSQATAELVAGELEGLSLHELGEHRLKDLTLPVRLHELVGEGLERDFPPPKTLENRPTNLPVQPTPFLGRERELAEVRELLSREELRLLTLTGPGGTGKTRLALQAAAELVERYPQGVFLVTLAPVSDPELVLPTIAQTLALKEQPGEPLFETLKSQLADRQLLLLLDNFEQVEAAAPLVGELLAAAPRLNVLVTSRAPLHLAAEHEYPVSPLAEEQALQLFVERAQAVRPGFTLDGNRPVVLEICRRLDHLPLAVELAAARVKLLPPSALLQRLDARLKLLTGGARDREERQRTLRGAIEWSHELLGAEEQRLFRRLAVFAGGWTLEAAEAVCAADGELDVLDGLGSLLDKSLIRQSEVEGQPRFSMLETIREYAAEKLAEAGQAAELRRQHAEYFSRLAERMGGELSDRISPDLVDRLAADLENFRSALE